MTKKTDIRFNDKLKPTFKRGTLVALTKDSSDYSSIASEFHPYNDYFKKNCPFIVIQCGFSTYFINDTGRILNSIDNEDMCHVESLHGDLNYSPTVAGIVKAQDLKICTLEELELD